MNYCFYTSLAEEPRNIFTLNWRALFFFFSPCFFFLPINLQVYIGHVFSLSDTNMFTHILCHSKMLSTWCLFRILIMSEITVYDLHCTIWGKKTQEVEENEAEEILSARMYFSTEKVQKCLSIENLKIE